MTYHFPLPLVTFGAVETPPNVRPAASGETERNAMVRAIPALRRYAKRLVGNSDRADDLVQEALARGIANVASFQPGTNMEAWLIIILRNLFLTQCRQSKLDLAYKASLRTAPRSAHAHQYSALQLRELGENLVNVPEAQRKALLLVSAYGYSYEEAAAICGCPPGTVKSRVNRARSHIAKSMHVDHAAEFGPAERELAVIAATSSGETTQERLN
jgi:RNA polymerase sigma-70 factor, ECF subfamily